MITTPRDENWMEKTGWDEGEDLFPTEFEGAMAGNKDIDEDCQVQQNLDELMTQLPKLYPRTSGRSGSSKAVATLAFLVLFLLWFGGWTLIETQVGKVSSLSDYLSSESPEGLMENTLPLLKWVWGYLLLFASFITVFMLTSRLLGWRMAAENRE